MTIAVAGGSGAPTGTVTLSGGGYTGSATTLTSGSASISYPGKQLERGNGHAHGKLQRRFDVRGYHRHKYHCDSDAIDVQPCRLSAGQCQPGKFRDLDDHREHEQQLQWNGNVELRPDERSYELRWRCAYVFCIDCGCLAGCNCNWNGKCQHEGCDDIRA